MDERIGHYRIVSELGRGGMGVVYKAHEESLNRFVAIKVLGEHLASDPQYVERFLREARSAAALNHPNIVQIHAVGEHQGRHYFVMEYVSGASVQQLLARHGKLPLDDAARLVVQAAAGLAAAHDRGIVHRDVKPANLLVDERGLVKIADFGLAFLHTASSRLTATGVFMGTPGYLAPEQCREEEVDGRTDIYALGVTFFEALAGRMPFTATSPLALLRQIMEVEPPDVRELNPDVDEATRDVLVRMMAKDRRQRVASCHELIAELQAILDARAAANFAARPAAGLPRLVARPPQASAVTPPAIAAAPLVGTAPTVVVAGPTPTGFDRTVPTARPTPPPVPPPPPPAVAATPTQAAAAATVPPIVATTTPRRSLLPFALGFAGVVLVVLVAVVALRLGRDGGDVDVAVVASPTAAPDEGAQALQPTAAMAGTPVARPTRAAATPTRSTQPQANAAGATASPLAEPTPTEPAAAPERPTAAPAAAAADEVATLITQLRSGDSAAEQRAAKILYRNHRSEERVQRAAAEVLLDRCAEDLDDGRHVDAMSWLCNILGASGDARYVATLKKVEQLSEHRKIDGYAEKNRKLLK